MELECETCSIYTINVKESSEQINNESMKYLHFPPKISNNGVRLQAFLVSSKFILLSVSLRLFLSQPIKETYRSVTTHSAQAQCSVNIE